MTSSLRTIAAVLAATAVVGCAGGGDDNDQIVDAASFIGTWRNTSGSVTITCAEDPENPVSFSTAGETTVIQAGVESDLQIVEEDCVVPLDFNGTSAQLIAPTTCTATDEAGTIALTLNTYTFSTQNGMTATESGNGAAAPEGNGPELHCGFVVSGTLEKL